MKTTTIYFIVNKEAGEDEDLRTLVERLRDDGYRVEVRATWEGGHSAHFAEEAVGDGADVVVACGGDGTLHEVLNALMKSEPRPVMAGLPYGTGNDFLEGLGIEPRTALGQFEALLDESPTTIDVGRMGDRYFLNMATAGAGAEVTADASQEFKEVVGSFAYFVRAIPAAFNLPIQSARVRAPGFEWDGELAFLFVGNGTQSGGGWRFCPAARLDDGWLDLVIIPDMPLREMARHGREMVQAETTGDFGSIKYRQVESVSVEFSEEVPLNLDGEPQAGQKFDFSLSPGAIRFLLPKK